MKVRAVFLKTFLLSLQEKADHFKFWIQPVVRLLARVCEPSHKPWEPGLDMCHRPRCVFCGVLQNSHPHAVSMPFVRL